MNRQNRQHWEGTAPVSLQLSPQNPTLSSVQHQAHKYWLNLAKPSTVLRLWWQRQNHGTGLEGQNQLFSPVKSNALTPHEFRSYLRSSHLWTKASIIHPCSLPKPLPLMGTVRTTEYLSASPAPGEHLLVTWKEITLSPLPALFTASHLYKADTLAAWITRVLTVCEKNKSQAINNGAYVYAQALRLKLSVPPTAATCLLHSYSSTACTQIRAITIMLILLTRHTKWALEP